MNRKKNKFEKKEFTDSVFALLEVKEIENSIIDATNLASLVNQDHDYSKELSSPYYTDGVTWAGADTVVATKNSPSLKDWLRRNQSHSAVITKFGYELGWLIFKLKRIYSKKIDFVTKYFFYADLIDSAKKYEKLNTVDPNPKGLLLHVLMESKKYLWKNDLKKSGKK